MDKGKKHKPVELYQLPAWLAALVDIA